MTNLPMKLSVIDVGKIVSPGFQRDGCVAMRTRRDAFAEQLVMRVLEDAGIVSR